MKEDSIWELSTQHEDPLIRTLHKVIRLAIRALAVVMCFVILWALIDVVWVIYKRLIEPPFMLMTVEDILYTFGAFLAVLIAIEIFLNITLYLRDDIIHVKLVISTALMAIARKVIVFDFKDLKSEYVFATAAVIVALGLGYGLISKQAVKESSQFVDGKGVR